MDTALLLENLVSPITLAFVLGMVAALIRSDLEIPEPVIRIISIFLLFSIGLQGGRELAQVELGDIAGAIAVTAGIVLFIPLIAFLIARHVVGLDIRNAAGVAALYGSMSSVTFIVARSFAEAQGTPMDGFVTGLVALMELGILVALFYGRWALSRSGNTTGSGRGKVSAILLETLRGRSLVLLVGGLVIGAASGERNFERIEPFFVELFRGVLVIFLLEMGMAAASRLREFMRVGGRMLAFGVLVPLVNGTLVALAGTLVGLSLGSAFVLACAAASASYIDAPAAVRATFPEANPSIYLTSSVGVTLPFMLVLGIPLLYGVTAWWQTALG
jgi:hypothetical protein